LEPDPGNAPAVRTPLCPHHQREYSLSRPDPSQMLPKHGLAGYVGKRLRVAGVP